MTEVPAEELTSASPEALEYLETVDPSGFDLEAFAQKVPKPWGHEVIYTRPDSPVVGKLEYVMAGKRLSLQVHDVKVESWILISGVGGAVLQGPDGRFYKVEFEPGRGYRSTVGQIHRLYADTDCVFSEVSTPETGNTYRLQDDFARPDETEELRAQPGRGWQE